MKLHAGAGTLCLIIAAGQQTVRFGVPEANYRPWFDFTNGTHQDLQLFVPLFAQALSSELGIEFKYVPLTNFTPSVFYQRVYDGLLDEDYDIAWIPLQRGLDPFNFPGVPPGSLTMTCSFSTDYLWALISRKTSPINFFRFLEPFSWKLWLAFVGCISLVACLMVFIHRVAPLEGTQDKITVEFVAGSVYHAWAAFLGGGGTYEWLTAPARVLHIAVLFLVLVTSATYTANLAAFFTKPNFQLIGPQSMDEARESTVCVPYSTNVDTVRPFVRNVIFAPEEMTPQIVARAEWCHDQMRSGNADAYIEPSSTSRAFLLQNCDSLARAEGIEFSPVLNVFVLRSSSRELQATLTHGILRIMAAPLYQSLMRVAFSSGRSCEDGEEDSDTVAMTLYQMKGFFAIFGGLGLLAAAVAAVQAAARRVRRRSSGGTCEVHEGMTDAEMILQLSRKLDRLIKQVPALHKAHMTSVGKGSMVSMSI